MMRVMLLLLSILSISAFGQSDSSRYQKFSGYGFRADRLWGYSVLLAPSDTTNNKLGLARIGTTLYVGNGTRWTAAGGSIDTTVISTRAWRQKGLDSLAAISTLQKAINTGATLTQNNTINGAGFNLSFDNFSRLNLFAADTIGLTTTNGNININPGNDLNVYGTTNVVGNINATNVSGYNTNINGSLSNNNWITKHYADSLNSLNTLATVTANGDSTGTDIKLIEGAGIEMRSGAISFNATYPNQNSAFLSGLPSGYTDSRSIFLPNASGTLPLSVNSQTANSSGAITLTAANVGALGTADSLTSIRSNFTSIGRAYKIADSLSQGFLRLTGGTLTGALTGTTASFTGAINSNTLTASRIPYIGTNGALRTNSLLAYDSATGRILIGTTTSRSIGGGERSFQIEGNATLLPAISIIRNSADAGGPTFYFGKSRNASVGGNTIVQNGDNLGFIGFVGSDGSNMTSIGAGLAAVVNGTPAGGFIPAQLEFRTTSSGSTPTTRMTIASAGNIGIGTTTPDASALQDMTSITRGFLKPRMTTAQWDAISSKAQGLEAFDVTQQKPMFVGTSSGITQWVNGTVFTQTNTVTVSNTTTESTVLGTGIGTKTIPANFLTAGKTIRLIVRGYMNETSTPTIRIRLKVGSVTVFDSNPVTINALGGTDKYFDAIFDITCRTTGTTGTVMPQGRWLYTANSGQTSVINGAVTATSTINTTISNALDLTVEWGTANASNNVNATNCSIEIIN